MSKELQDWLRTAPFRKRRELATRVRAAADRLRDALEAAAPLGETGKTKRSVKVRRTRNELKFYVTAGGDETTKEVRAGSGKPYDYVRAEEWGTTKQPPHPWFYPTARSLEPSIREELENAVSETILS